jgi:hypothetical protein
VKATDRFLKSVFDLIEKGVYNPTLDQIGKNMKPPVTRQRVHAIYKRIKNDIK